MKWWKFKASEHIERLTKRLTKFNGGQILMEGSDETIRGNIDTINISDGPSLELKLLWHAKKTVLSESFWFPDWKWELVTWDWQDQKEGRVPILSCTLNFRITEGNDKGHEENSDSSIPKAEEEKLKERNLKKFYQDKDALNHGVVFPKCLYLITDNGEIATLFQPDDPRNLRLFFGAIIDFFLPK